MQTLPTTPPKVSIRPHRMNSKRVKPSSSSVMTHKHGTLLFTGVIALMFSQCGLYIIFHMVAVQEEPLQMLMLSLTGLAVVVSTTFLFTHVRP